MKHVISYPFFFLVCCSITVRVYTVVPSGGPSLASVGNQPYMSAVLSPEDKPGKLWHWQANIALYGVNAESQFDQCGIKTPIEDYVFNERLMIGNTLLASKLSSLGLLSTTNAYGATPQQQYLAELAPTHLHFTPYYSEVGCLFRATYRWKPRNWEKVRVLIGTVFSFKQLNHNLLLDFDGGTLSANSQVPAMVQPNGTIIFEDNITQFFTDYSGLFNFFHDAMLVPKQLTYDEVQQRTGFGDLGLFTELEIADPGFFWTNKVNVGAALTLPTGNKATGYIIWEIELGNGGAIQLDLYTSIDFKPISLLGSLTFASAIRFSAPFMKSIRVPQIKTNISQVLLPPRFQSYFIDTPTGNFALIDSTSAQFSDEPSCARIIYGLIGIFTVTDEWYVPGLDAKLSFIYQGILKAIDDITVPTNRRKQYVTAIAEDQTDTVTHTVTGLIRWQFKKGKQDCELNLGTEAVVGGKNVLNTHKIFAGFTMSF
jgi:hypothetical protein